MKQYPIHELEARRDWPVIVTSVECPTCGAQKGERCKQVATALAGFGQQSDRIDFHAARKYAAAQFLEEHPFPSGETVKVCSTCGHEFPKDGSKIPVKIEGGKYCPDCGWSEGPEKTETEPQYQHKTYGVVGTIEGGEIKISNSPDGGPLQSEPKRTRKKKNTPTSE